MLTAAVSDWAMEFGVPDDKSPAENPGFAETSAPKVLSSGGIPSFPQLAEAAIATVAAMQPTNLVDIGSPPLLVMQMSWLS
jgi:hypothetical protein